MDGTRNSLTFLLWAAFLANIGFAQTPAEPSHPTDKPSSEAAPLDEATKDAPQLEPAPIEATKAEPDAKRPLNLWTRETLTGDWGGARTRLEEKGISLRLFLNQQLQDNFRGGLDTHNGHRYSGSYDLQFVFDFGKMGLWNDAGVFFEAKGNWSDGINPGKVGALFNVNADAGGDHAIYVNKWWYWQTLFDKKLEFRLGRLQSNKDLFDVSPYANHEDKDFLNRNSVRDATIPHRTGIGAFAKVQPIKWLYVQAAAIDAQSRERRTGFDTAFHDEAWFTGFLETGIKQNWASAKGPMPGNARIGFWYDPIPKTLFENNLGGRRQAEIRTGDVGFYVGADQLIWKENADEKDQQGLGVFGRYGHADGDANRINHYWEVGVSYRGIFPTRDRDVTAFAVSQGILSDDYRDVRDELADRETVYEWYYAFQLTPWCIISPDLQFITNPGGDQDDRDAIVGGIRVRISF